jgi:hypothetical protein|tara:strand:+ start:267 stop:851 length:585 start_codon:yes stop_codon:yes gene_type:complete
MCFGGGDAPEPEESAAKLALAETAASNLRRYSEVFVPLENLYIDKATSSFEDGNYTDPMGAASNQASDVYEKGVADATGGAFARGLDPNSGAFMAESDALRTAQARAMGDSAAATGLDITDKGFGMLTNVVNMGQGLSGEVLEGQIDQSNNQLSALQRRAEEDFSRSSSIQSLAGTGAGMGAAYGLNRNESRYS